MVYTFSEMLRGKLFCLPDKKVCKDIWGIKHSLTKIQSWLIQVAAILAGEPVKITK